MSHYNSDAGLVPLGREAPPSTQKLTAAQSRTLKGSRAKKKTQVSKNFVRTNMKQG
jgi:hypothetical protein